MNDNSILFNGQVDEGLDLGGGLDDAFGCCFTLFFIGAGILGLGTIIYKIIT